MFYKLRWVINLKRKCNIYKKITNIDMIFMFFQFDTPEMGIGLYITIIFAFIIGLIMLKIGLVITKAEARTAFKWLIGSFGIQVGMFFFVASPLILMGVSGAFGEHGPEIILIIIFLIVALFMDIHILNVLHRVGLKRALLVFGFMALPFLMVTFSIITLIVFFV